MRSLLFILKFVFLFALLINGCKPIHRSGNGIENSLKTTSLDFAQIKREILDESCISCHTGRHNAYESYLVVKTDLKNIIKRVESNRPNFRMPPEGPPLAQSLIDKLKEWEQAGAPEFSEPAEPPPSKEEIPSVVFSDIREQVLEPHCLSCHTHFQSYWVVKEKLGSILSLVQDDKMPFPQKKGQKVRPLEEPLKALLVEWAEQEAPFSIENKEGPMKTSLEPNWGSLRDHVFGPKCILCHNSFGPRAPTFMGTYTELVQWKTESPLLFNEDDPLKSHFIGAILGRVDPDNEEFFFDPMPFNSPADDVPTDLPPVSEEELEVIQEWIRLGLPK